MFFYLYRREELGGNVMMKGKKNEKKMMRRKSTIAGVTSFALIASLLAGSVSVKALASEPVSDENTMTWRAEEAELGIGTGYGSYFNYGMASRFEADDLQGFKGKLLDEIGFYFIEGNVASLSATVSVGGSRDGAYFDPGTEIYSQEIDVNTLKADAWNMFKIDVPLELDVNQETWIQFSFTAEGFPMGACGSSVYEGKDNLICFNDWDTLSNYGLDYAWCIVGNLIDVAEDDWMASIKDQINGGITAAAMTGMPQTVKYQGDFALSYEIMEALANHPEVTLEYTATYEGETRVLSINGSQIQLDEEIPWYGPAWLMANF